MSGGSGYSYTNPSELNRKLKETQDELKKQEYESEINLYINDMLSVANKRDVEALNRHIEEIKKAIEREFQDTDSIITRFGGSVSKHTYVDGLSDVDILVVINNSELVNNSPEEVKNYFYDKLSKRFPNTDIMRGNLAVTMHFKDMEVQLLPTVRYQSGVKIADKTGMQWSKIIKPHVFARALRIRNKQLNGNLVPVIKAVKSIISEFPEKRRISGYHVEAISYELFKNYTGKINRKSMISHFFENASNIIKNPMKDKTGQSKYVDSYLGSKNSLERLMVSDSLERVNRNIKNADSNFNKDYWKSIL